MDLKNLKNQVLALAGVYQACQQVKKTAWKGQSDAAQLDTVLGSVFKLDSANIDDVYGGRHRLNEGLDLLANELDPQTSSHDLEIARYVIALLALHKKLMKRDDLIKIVRDGIESANTQREHYGINHPNTWAALGDIYQKSISSITPRIMVNGERAHLSNTDNAAKIRALLLAGIRSAVLWNQCGGSRLLFAFNRRNYFLEARSLLAS
jgi:high frequency lysogenization protein